MCWVRFKTFGGCGHATHDLLLCCDATPDLRRCAQAGCNFLATCQNDDARQSYESPESINQPNCCTLACCTRTLQLRYNRVWYLETRAGARLGHREGLDFSINTLPRRQRRVVTELKNAQAEMMAAAKLHWQVCGSRISHHPVEPNGGIQTSSRIDLGFDLEDIEVEQQQHSILEAFLPEILQIRAKRMALGRPL